MPAWSPPFGSPTQSEKAPSAGVTVTVSVAPACDGDAVAVAEHVGRERAPAQDARRVDLRAVRAAGGRRQCRATPSRFVSASVIVPPGARRQLALVDVGLGVGERDADVGRRRGAAGLGSVSRERHRRHDRPSCVPTVVRGVEVGRVEARRGRDGSGRPPTTRRRRRRRAAPRSCAVARAVDGDLRERLVAGLEVRVEDRRRRACSARACATGNTCVARRVSSTPPAGWNRSSTVRAHQTRPGEPRAAPTRRPEPRSPWTPRARARRRSSCRAP